jgi:hypothetical protein
MTIANTVLFFGAGLSSVAGLPTTRELTQQFLSLPPTEATGAHLQDLISTHLRSFWDRVFAHAPGGSNKPSFEDHFTVLDLAANTGHNLGAHYTPRQLRAIRRLSIHRVFDILDSRFAHNEVLGQYLHMLTTGTGNAVVTTNWDIVAERHLGDAPFHYSVPMTNLSGDAVPRDGLPIMKLHGSSNWAYCDCCGRLFAFGLREGKGALHRQIFIDPTDFAVLGEVADAAVELRSRRATCPFCNVPLSSRVATFSFVKVLDFVHFSTIWDNTFNMLRDASEWIFVGYSLPEADFQLRHLLKRAQLAHSGGSLKITVVAAGAGATADRYSRFFGDALECVVSDGFDKWASGVLKLSEHEE